MAVRRCRSGGLCLVLSAASATTVSFQKDVQPILAARCQVCHSEKNPSGKLVLTSTKSILAGGAAGPAIRPGHPEQSVLLQFITGDPPRMPKAGAAVRPEDVDIIRRWIAEGAKDDSDRAPAQEVWWSLRPLSSPGIPSGNGAWARTPIDAFIQDRLAKAKLTPSVEADRRTLIRRLYFDLLGLPPSPEDIKRFLEDPDPKAYERLVDELLASPRYGERWARHWLDVVHYGDSHGYDKDKPRAHAWPYRDYVIRAFSEDKPYKRFVKEQLAGDVLYPNDPDAFVATGFIAAGPWDFVGHQELREGTTDKENTRLLDRDDMVAATISTFTSMTAHCARCHDHKFDPIPQADYYNLQSVFAGVDRADRPYDDDPELNDRRQTLIERRRAVQIRLQPYLDAVEFATNPAIVELDDRIQDAGLLIAHIGSPKTAEDAERKRMLEARRMEDRRKRKEEVDRVVPLDTYAAIERMQKEAASIDAEIEKLPKPKLVYSAASYFSRAGTFRPALQPRPISILDRGSVQSPGKPASPGALSAVAAMPSHFEIPQDAEEGARRAALAKWIADERNVLTWRSIVNRVWHYHFGSGIVDSPGDFGRMGSQPSHPELLDWLAVWFRDDARGSLKTLHRLIVTSAVYRQSSSDRAESAKVDADNRLLWRMNRMRLDAETFRDSVLSVAGKLDLTMGGPGDRMFLFKDDHSPVYDYSLFDADDPAGMRRSIYRFIVRSAPDPFMERLDCPDPSALTPKRSTTLTAIQALATLNNPFMVRMSEHFAERLQRERGNLPAQVTRAVELVHGRAPSASESEAYEDYARKHGLPNLCRLLLNTNEFLFLD